MPLTWRNGLYQAKLAYYHLSSHAGDEFLLAASPDFTRINFSRNALVLGAGYFLLPDFRLHGGRVRIPQRWGQLAVGVCNSGPSIGRHGPPAGGARRSGPSMPTCGKRSILAQASMR
ncbi:MAG: hypothetical protein CMJ58_00255 [Planctomycetaceae bacterium]|nr:hypothetical protein [Planctomycetaceae bacterium]